MDVRVRLAGRLAVTLDGAELPAARLGSRRGRQLLALLVVHRPGVVGAERIGAVLWPDGASTVRDVAPLVSRLRGVLGRDAVAGDRSGYRLGAGVRVDLDEAAALLASAAALQDEPAIAGAAAAGALRLLDEGEPLAEEGDWAAPARRQWLELGRDARHLRVQAAVAVGDGASALLAAGDPADPLDERAVRDRMAALHAAGRDADALRAYGALRERLADELGTDPAAETEAAYLALLRGEDVPHRAAAGRGAAGTDLVGRDDELDRLRRLWSATVAGRPATVLISGESGIGKTALAESLAELAEATGATVLRARCYDTERSLLLQPLADVLRAALTTLPAQPLAEVTGEHAPTLLHLLPDLAPVLGAPVALTGPAELQHRRIVDAVAGTLSRFGRRRPTLVLIDDLHDAGQSTVELLHYLARRAGHTAVLVAATIQPARAPQTVETLRPVSHVVELGPLDAPAVTELARRHGQAERSAALLQRTGGHPMFLVESLRALSSADGGVPQSLRAVVLQRVRALADPAEAVLRAAAVFGAAAGIGDLAHTAALPAERVAAVCEQALDAHVLAVSGSAYEFVHDLTREVLYDATPAPTRVVLHLRAADRLEHRPEALAAHAAAAEDWPRAARAWLRASRDALRRWASADAERIAVDALFAADRAGDRTLRGAALVQLGRARDGLGQTAEAAADLRAAAALAREVGDRRLELDAVSALMPDSLAIPVADGERHLRRAVALCRELDEPVAEAFALGRLAIFAANRLRFRESIARAERTTAVARETGDDDRAVATALDSVKTAWAYLGEVDRLPVLIDQLDAAFRRDGDWWFLQWTVFESALVPLAAGDVDAALALMEQSREINRRSGQRWYAPWFAAHAGWAHRLSGDLDAALQVGRDAWRDAAGTSHPWWRAGAASFYAVTLLECGRPEQAVQVLAEVRAEVEANGVEAYLLRVLAPLAEATGDAAIRDRADALLAGIDAPDGSAWLLGADAYLSVARAWRDAGEPQRAREVLAPLLAAARRVPWQPLLGQVEPLLARLG